MSKEQTKFWTMKRTTTAKTTGIVNSAEILIYGTIGLSWWDESISALQFSRDLKDLGDDLEEIIVRINSAGGSVFDGLAIRSLLKNHKATVSVHVDGWAASIASIIAMAGDKIHMAKGSMMMIHNPMNSVWGGQAKDFREMADFLDKVRDSLVDVYTARTGITREELIDLMDAETWMNADEAVEKGFADEVEASNVVAVSMQGAVAMVNGVQMDYSRFKKMPIVPVATILPPPEIQNNEKQLKGSKSMNLDELKTQHPALFNEVINLGIAQERSRITELNALAGAPGAAAIVAKAIEDGKTAGEAAMDIVKASTERLTSEGRKRLEDAINSGMDNVPADEPPLKQNAEAEAQAEAEANALVAEIKTLRGAK